MNFQLRTSTYGINSDLPHASGIKGLNNIIINFRGAYYIVTIKGS